MRGLATAVLVSVSVVVAACGAGGGEESTTPSTTSRQPAGRALASVEAAALTRMAEADRAAHHAGGHAHRHGHGDGGHGVFGPVAEVPLPAGEQAAFEREWSAAVAAAARLLTPGDATAAGYAQAAAPTAGTGAHWVRWTLVDRPFDAAAPSMLLFEQRPGRPQKLAGFSYWVRATAGPPDGFAGPNDHWHRHRGLCFVDGWLDREDVPAPEDCEGDWLAGDTLWMLHAWVVPDRPNPWGRFAPAHPDLCPPRGTVPDVVSCEPLAA